MTTAAVDLLVARRRDIPPLLRAAFGRTRRATPPDRDDPGRVGRVETTRSVSGAVAPDDVGAGL
jgi:hypothetical protein